MAIKVNLKKKITDILKNIDELNKKKALDDQDKKKKEALVSELKVLAAEFLRESRNEKTEFAKFLRKILSSEVDETSKTASLSEREDEEDSEELWAQDFNENFVASSSMQASTDRDFMRSVSEQRGQEVIVIDEAMLKDGSIMYKINGGNSDDIKNAMQKIADKMDLNLHIVEKDGNIDFKITSKDDKSLVDMRTFMKAVHDGLKASKHNVAVHPLKTEMVERVREAVKETAKVDVNAAAEHHAKPPVKAA